MPKYHKFLRPVNFADMLEKTENYEQMIVCFNNSNLHLFLNRIATLKKVG
jgi:hypothetical protein